MQNVVEKGYRPHKYFLLVFHELVLLTWLWVLPISYVTVNCCMPNLCLFSQKCVFNFHMVIDMCSVIEKNLFLPCIIECLLLWLGLRLKLLELCVLFDDLNEWNYPTGALWPIVSGIPRCWMQNQTAELGVKVFDWAFFSHWLLKPFNGSDCISFKKKMCLSVL